MRCKFVLEELALRSDMYAKLGKGINRINSCAILQQKRQ